MGPRAGRLIATRRSLSPSVKPGARANAGTAARFRALPVHQPSCRCSGACIASLSAGGRASVSTTGTATPAPEESRHSDRLASRLLQRTSSSSDGPEPDPLAGPPGGRTPASSAVSQSSQRRVAGEIAAMPLGGAVLAGACFVAGAGKSGHRARRGQKARVCPAEEHVPAADRERPRIGDEEVLRPRPGRGPCIRARRLLVAHALAWLPLSGFSSLGAQLTTADVTAPHR